MTRLVDVDLQCPNCGHGFSAPDLASFTVFGQTTEFQPILPGGPGVGWVVHTCPGCGFSGDQDRFDEPVPPGVGALVADRLTPLLRDGVPPVPRRWDMAARVAEWYEDSDETVARLLLCAAWTSPEPRKAEGYRRQAIIRFARALDDDVVDAEDVPAVTYLVGELYRRIGELDAADAWLARAERLAAADPSRAELAALAARQRTTPSDTI